MKTCRMLLAVLAGFALFAVQAQAQYKPTGDDGITASPKLRAQLNERKAASTTTAVTAAPMACPKCKDTLVSRPNTDSKGVGSRTLMGTTTKLVATHLCPGCGTDWAVAGHGKSKQSIASHKCEGCGVADLACCNTSKGSVAATKGMEKFQVAPIK